MKKLIFFALFASIPALLKAGEPVSPSAILTPAEKVAGLSTFRQEVEYNFVFMEQVDRKAWDSAFLALIPAVAKSANDYEYYRLLQRFCALLNDGHTYVRPPLLTRSSAENSGKRVTISLARNCFREGYLEVSDVGGVPVVNKVDCPLAVVIPLGSRVVSVDGIEVEDYIRENTLPYVSQNTDHMRRIYSVGMITQGLDGRTMKLGFVTPHGESRETELTFSVHEKEPAVGELFTLHKVNSPWQWIRYEETVPGIGYLQLNSFNGRDVVAGFERHLPEIRNAKALVIDIRSNGGGSTRNGTSILQYFTEVDTLYGSCSRTRKHIAAFKASGIHVNSPDTVGADQWAKTIFLASRGLLYEELGQMVHEITVPLEERIIIPLAVLTGYGTASAAEDFLIFADGFPNITRVGTKTNGSTGQPLTVSLPGGIWAGICSKEDTFPDGRRFVGVGVLPHIEVIPTVEEMLAGEDKVLEVAVEYLKGLLEDR